MEDTTFVLDQFLTYKLKRGEKYADAVVYKQTNGNWVSYLIRQGDGTEVRLNDMTRDYPGGRFKEASEAINVLVRAERARDYKQKHSHDYDHDVNGSGKTGRRK